MPTITSTESCAAGRYVNLGSPSSQDDVGAQTIVAYCKPTGSGENGLGYLLSKATASHWLRFIVDHNGGSPRLNFGADSSGTSGSPSAATNNNSITYNVNQHFAATWDGSLNKSGILIYDESGSMAISGSIGANGSGTLNSDAAGDLILLNRNSTNRALVGDVYYIARWSRVLNWTELQNVFANGPLSEPTGLILCWANQQDYSTLALTPTSRSTFVAGGAAPNTALGPDSATVSSSTGTGTGSASGGDATGQIAGDVSGGTGVGTGSATGGDATAGGSATVSSSTGVGTGSASGGTPTGTDTTILSPVDRGNINLASSSVLNADTSTPTLNIVPRTMINDWLPAKSLQFHWYGAADKVNGKTPQFKVKFWTSTTHNTSTDIILYATDFPFNIAGGYRPEWSYDARTWYPFDNCVYDADNLHLRFYNNTAFTSGTVYYSTTTPWQESLTGEWLASLPTTYIQATASVTTYSGPPYVFGQSVPRVNELGEDIDACNLYAFKISSGSGLAPNGQSKKKFLVFAGNHAGEDPGNWALKGLVEFLIGTDAKAVTARQWLDFYVYPMICPAGRRGGHWRSDWEPGFLTYDANRHWTDSSMSTIVAFKNAIISDTGGSVAGGISFHSSFPTTTQTYTYPSGEVTALQSALTPVFGSLYPSEFYDIPSSSNGWMVNTLGARVAMIPETIAKPAAALETYGANYGKVISDLALTNYFSNGDVTVSDGGAASGTGSASGGDATGSIAISCNAGNATTAGIAAAFPQTISFTVGNATTAGVTAGIGGATVISCNAGNASVAGISAGISNAITISCTVGGATTAGVSAAFPKSLSCNVGNATTAGITAQVDIAGQIVIGCNAGTATTAGIQANISSALILACNAGNATTLGGTAYFPQSLQCTSGNAIALGIGATLTITGPTTIVCNVGNATASGVNCYFGGRLDAPPDAIVTVINKRNRVSVISRRS